MPRRNPTIYHARLSKLKATAFGIDQILPWETEIQIYQARVSPELWRARPMMQHAQHKWEAASAEALMFLITQDFIDLIEPWKDWNSKPAVPLRPTLVRRSDESGRAAG